MLPRALASAAVFFALAGAHAETLVVQAKILRVEEGVIVLEVERKPLALVVDSKAKFWFQKAAADREVFKPSLPVFVRIKTDTDPPQLKELADVPTWQWLDKLRNEPCSGAIEAISNKHIVLALDDGSRFTFRATDKTEVHLGGKKRRLADLEIGMKVFGLGRTLSNLDTWLAKVSDKPIPKPEASANSGDPGKGPPKPLPDSGRLEGKSGKHYPDLKMFDILYEGRKLHITYTAQTKWIVDATASKSSALQQDLDCIVSYRRDTAGRILATKVELFHRK